MERTKYYELLETIVNDFGKNSILAPNNIWSGDLKLNYDLQRDESVGKTLLDATITITDGDGKVLGGIHKITKTLNNLELTEDFINKKIISIKEEASISLINQIFLNGLKHGQI